VAAALSDFHPAGSPLLLALVLQVSLVLRVW
jgi:hypothetical protein